MPPQPHALRSYAFIADGERGALVGPDGGMVWLPFPRWHDDPLFDSLLGGSGFYQVHPRGPSVWGGRYEGGGLIWRNRWVLRGGAIIECRDALAMPADPSRAVLLRRLEHVAGAEIETAVRLQPARGVQGRRLEDVHRDGAAVQARAGDVWLRWSGLRLAEDDGDWVEGSLRLAEGAAHDFVLELSRTPLRHAAPDAQRLWEQTEKAWQQRVPELLTAAPRDARHAVAVLAGLTSQSGGLVAAATTSLPERVDAGRNYDYRYAWIRDQSYAGQAAAAAGIDALLEGWVGFVRDRLLEDGARLHPVYRVDGEAVEEQHEVGLPGYPGGGCAVFGNRARDQFQLDCFGEALLLFAAAGDRDRLGSEEWRAVEAATQAIEQRWQEPDFGVWETEPRQWTHSKLICASGLVQIARHAAAAEGRRWHELGQRILGETARTSLHRSGRWQRAADDEGVDASLLLPQVRGLLDAADTRSQATRRAVIDELIEDGHVYRHARARDEEGAFLLCNYWLALADLRAGDAVGAARRFERARAACGPAGLFAEEYEVEQRQLRGNLPQAFVHALLLETAVRMAARSERDVEPGRL
jgi:alpha,alpha-trehalase